MSALTLAVSLSESSCPTAKFDDHHVVRKGFASCDAADCVGEFGMELALELTTIIANILKCFLLAILVWKSLKKKHGQKK